MGPFRFHHVAISVSDLERSMAFYAYFGFSEVLRWEASDRSLRIAHLRNQDGQFLEIVCYASHEVAPSPGVGNDLTRLGVKHFAFCVEDPGTVRQDIISRGLGEATELEHGRTLLDLFFVRDPDGYWVEVVSDARDLEPGDPTIITEAPRLLAGE